MTSIPLLDEVLPIAHRGLNRVAPENTLSAFQAAADAGAKWIETDVDIAADGTVIVMHDSRLERTTNHCGKVADLTASELPGIDAGGWFSPQFKGEPLPTLPMLVRWANQAKMNMNVELKPNPLGKVASLRQIEAVGADLAHLDDGRQIIISSFSVLLLAEFKRRFPQYPTAVLTTAATLPPDWRSVMELCGASYLHPEGQGLTAQLVADLRDAGFGVNPWTINSMAEANQLKNWGCTAVITDIADRMAPVL